MDALHVTLIAEQTATEEKIFCLESCTELCLPNRWQNLWQNPEGLPESTLTYTQKFSHPNQSKELSEEEQENLVYLGFCKLRTDSN